ncbi:hypothetical protein GCM10027451_32260 [Geodermatophilus aquaeductus]|uniref:PQQ-like domain-containing protein n=1 Tax=Geodermatophilus aquaeductus TaxID=1564161 RepID=A0A521F0H0_9ACTN|nr:hypothetical protein [Geodermatophilus aquaeductus]SMO89576.1 hypothetical protein SAMN06273567_106211 [Geodermatophilus aquaeductus]
MSRSRLLSPLLLLPAVVLATASCTAAPPVQEAARIVVTVPGDAPAGDHADPRAVLPGPDGTLLVLVAGAVPEAGAALAVVGTADAAVRSVAPLAPGTDPDTAFGWEGSAVVAGVVWPGSGPVAYALQVVDPASGAVTATVPVELPEGATLSGTSAVLGSDGVLYLAVSRIDDGPVLLTVHPATGEVLASAPLDLGDPGEGADLVAVTDLAVAPDGETVAVVAQVLDRQGAGRSDEHAVVLTVDAGLAPLRDPVVIAPEWSSSLASAVNVGRDGTVYATASGRPEGTRSVESLWAIAPGGDTATSLTGDDDLDVAVADLAVAGGTIWLAGGTVAGALLSSADAATGDVSDPLTLCDDGVGSVAAGSDGRVAFAARCDGEAVLWLLEPR